MHSGLLLWLLAGLGFLAGKATTRSATLFLLGLLVSSFLAFSAGFYFRQHYYIFILPAVSLFAGIAVSAACELADRWARVWAPVMTIFTLLLVQFTPFLLFCVALSQPVLAARKLYFEASAVEASHIVYGENPFPESVRIAEYLRDHTDVGDTIAVLGSEPQIYFYSKRHSATGYIYTYELMEPQSYQLEIQKEKIRRSNPHARSM
jgi:hypothetical protein